MLYYMGISLGILLLLRTLIQDACDCHDDEPHRALARQQARARARAARAAARAQPPSQAERDTALGALILVAPVLLSWIWTVIHVLCR
jgi:hypothetical protein